MNIPLVDTMFLFTIWYSFSYRLLY